MLIRPLTVAESMRADGDRILASWMPSIRTDPVQDIWLTKGGRFAKPCFKLRISFKRLSENLADFARGLSTSCMIRS